MTNKNLMILCFIVFFTMGCTTAGPKFIGIQYIGQKKAVRGENIGIAMFSDIRGDVEKNYLGKRVLNSGAQELYFVKSSNLNATITNAFKTHLENQGYTCFNILDFQHNVSILNRVDKKYQYILTGEIKEFEFFANKGLATAMSMDIKLIVYLGNVKTGTFRTIPVNLNLKRKDINFTEKRVGNFINESLKEVIIHSMKPGNFK